ncbi:hypothetical protein M378DRAFT_174552, partial [Amanita muscaria Koide BX008]
MLSYIVPKPKLSSDLVQAATPILTKEAQTHEQPTAALASLLSGHVSMLLQPDVDEPLPAETTALIAKEINNAKAGTKRGFCVLAGAVLFEGDTILSTEKGIIFAHVILPSLDSKWRAYRRLYCRLCSPRLFCSLRKVWYVKRCRKCFI